MSTYIHSSFETSNFNLPEFSLGLSRDAWENIKVFACIQDRIYAWDQTANTKEASGFIQRMKHFGAAMMLLPPLFNLITYVASCILKLLYDFYCFFFDSEQVNNDRLVKFSESPTTLNNYIYTNNDTGATSWYDVGEIQNYLKLLQLSHDFDLLNPYTENGQQTLGTKIQEHLSETPDETKPLVVVVNITAVHWALAYVDRKKKTIEYYDPKNWEGSKKCLAETAKELSFTFCNQTTQIYQSDGYQCGPWLCFFAKHRLECSDFDPKAFFKDDISTASSVIANFRKEMTQEVKDFREKILRFVETFDEKTKKKYENEIAMLKGKVGGNKDIAPELFNEYRKSLQK